MRAARWGDDDRYFWRFTWSPKGNSYNPWAIVLASRDEEGCGVEYCRLRIGMFGRSLIIALPDIIKPDRQWKICLDAHQIDRGYWDIRPREYGVTLGPDGHLNVAFGRQTDDSSTEQRWGYFLPWTQWRHVRHTYYTPLGDPFFDELPCPPGKGFEHYQAMREFIDACPTQTFAFKDFDGEELRATCRVEEMEWRFGTGWFKWLSWFRKPKIHRSLDIRFSGEVGKRKGSWKGGTVGHSIEMLDLDFPRTAFHRYCEQHKMTYLGQVMEEGDVRLDHDADWSELRPARGDSELQAPVSKDLGPDGV